jgi:hypothetical protein
MHAPRYQFGGEGISGHGMSSGQSMRRTRLLASRNAAVSTQMANISSGTTSRFAPLPSARGHLVRSRNSYFIDPSVAMSGRSHRRRSLSGFVSCHRSGPNKLLYATASRNAARERSVIPAEVGEEAYEDTSASVALVRNRLFCPDGAGMRRYGFLAVH